MKTYLTLLTVAFFVLTSCTTPQGAQSNGYSDDIYYSSKDAAAEKEQKKAEEAKQKAEEARQRAEEANRQAEAANQRIIDAGKSETPSTDDYYTPSDKSATVINNTTNNYYDQPFNYDDYYDDQYAVRIRRFHNYCPSYGYYDNYYTNSYWYTGNPYNYGTSIYMGYNFWGPSYYSFAYNPGYGYYSNMGWGYDAWYSPWGYSPYGYGGFGYVYGYNPYGYGYGYDPYGYGYNSNNYYNSYDNNSYYYGPRKTTGGNGRVSTQPSLAHRIMDNPEGQAILSPKDNSRGGGNEIRNNGEINSNGSINPAFINRPENNNNSGKPPVNDNSRPIDPATTYEKPSSNNGNAKPVNPPSDRNQPPVTIPSEKPVTPNQNNDRTRPSETPQPRYDQPKYEQPKSEPRSRPESSPRSDRSTSSPRSSSSSSFSSPSGGSTPSKGSSSSSPSRGRR